MDGLERAVDGPGQGVDGPGRAVDGPGRVVDGSGRAVDGPGRGVDGSGRVVDGPGRAVDGPGRAVDGSEWGMDGSGRGVDGTGRAAGSSDAKSSMVTSGANKDTTSSSVNRARSVTEDRSSYAATVEMSSVLVSSGSPRKLTIGSSETVKQQYISYGRRRIQSYQVGLHVVITLNLS